MSGEGPLQATQECAFCCTTIDGECVDDGDVFFCDDACYCDWLAITENWDWTDEEEGNDAAQPC